MKNLIDFLNEKLIINKNTKAGVPPLEGTNWVHKRYGDGTDNWNEYFDSTDAGKQVLDLLWGICDESNRVTNDYEDNLPIMFVKENKTKKGGTEFYILYLVSVTYVLLGFHAYEDGYVTFGIQRKTDFLKIWRIKMMMRNLKCYKLNKRNFDIISNDCWMHILKNSKKI